MRAILQYIKQYFSENDGIVFTITTFITGLLVFLNYHFNIDGLVRQQSNFGQVAMAWWFIFLFAFAFPYLLYGIVSGKDYLANRSFLFILLLAPLVFALRISITSINTCPAEGAILFWRPIINWSIALLFILVILLLLWHLFNKEQVFYGVKKTASLRPYWIMLLCMVPIIFLAAQQPDFLAQYPKWKIVESTRPAWWQKLLFELSYGSDFFTIELFFRGFLVLSFAKWAGKDAILPMACFYCAIHFSKPLGECISSYFGGLLLGIVIYHTRSIWGGLLVHLGIAWLMEIAGYIVQ